MAEPRIPCPVTYTSSGPGGGAEGPEDHDPWQVPEHPGDGRAHQRVLRAGMG